MTLASSFRNFLVRLERFEVGVQRQIIAWTLGGLIAATVLGAIVEII